MRAEIGDKIERRKQWLGTHKPNCCRNGEQIGDALVGAGLIFGADAEPAIFERPR